MKKILTLAIACLMLLSAIALTSCDLGGDDGVINMGTSTDAETANDETSAVPVPVESVNGKTAAQLLQKMKATISEMTTYEMYFDRVDKTDDSNVYKVTLKKAAKSAYMGATYGEDVQEAWHVDGTAYTVYNDSKEKTTEVSYEMFVESFQELAVSPVQLVDSVETLTSKLDNAQIYALGNTYYFEVSINADEAANTFGCDVTLKFIFDKDGIIAGMFVDSEEFSIDLKYANINKASEISKPQNADEFVEGTVKDEPNTSESIMVEIVADKTEL